MNLGTHSQNHRLRQCSLQAELPELPRAKLSLKPPGKGHLDTFPEQEQHSFPLFGHLSQLSPGAGFLLPTVTLHPSARTLCEAVLGLERKGMVCVLLPPPPDVLQVQGEVNWAGEK